MEQILTALKAVAEPTRLRLLALCVRSELTVSELTQILGQSQPRVSRHLKLLCDAGLLLRHPEGAWAFYRVADAGVGGEIARRLIGIVPENDAVAAADRERLEAVRRTRSELAKAYFRANAVRWREIRSLYVDEAEVEKALVAAFDGMVVDDLLDVGTGTGRVLELLGGRVRRGIGIDLSREMLALARANLERADLRHCQVRHGDMYRLPMNGASVDAVTFHQVLHFADDPGAAIAEAARVLRPGGRLVVVDFLPHHLEFLREQHAHRRLGFSDREVSGWCRAAGLDSGSAQHLPGDPLTVGVWTALRPRIANKRSAA